MKVPYAKIVPADLTNAVRASSDEVLVGQEQPDPSKRFEVLTGISLTLGDKVSMDTLGPHGAARPAPSLCAAVVMTSRAARASSRSRKASTPRTAAGSTSSAAGSCSAAGPVNNPGVDIRAVKEYPDVKAGVNVRGTLLQPRLSFFSEPSLPQSQIVSLILAGGSLESAQNRNNPATRRAAKRSPRAAPSWRSSSARASASRT